MGGKIDNEINKCGGPYPFRVNGQHCHLLGSLATLDGGKAQFAQLYIHDTENEIANRLADLRSVDRQSSLDEDFMRGLLEMLDEHNVLVQSFRMARDKFRDNEARELKHRLIGNRYTDGRQYNLPSCSEVAALIVGKPSDEETRRDIIVEHKSGRLQRITKLHPSFMTLQYPLLFPYREDGFRLGASHHNPETGKRYKQQTVTVRQYYAFCLQQRSEEAQTLLKAGRLLQQFLVDAYAYIEEGRLNWILNNHKKLRAELYDGLRYVIK
ncbi:hypothetical protein CRG98_043379 [Punica granatum]|nr:hypothetical protein CRG98_043379 [Punica granatum]